MLVNHSEREQLKEWLRLVAEFVDQQLEAGFGCFKLKPFVFQSLQFVEDSLLSCKFEIKLTSLGLQVSTSRKIRNDYASSITDQLRSNVFVSQRIAFDRGDVHTTLVSEGTRTDKRSGRSKLEVCELTNETRSLAQLPQTCRSHPLAAKLQLEIWNHRTKICIA